ncbi:hypothetical protein [Citrobacter enshiensis]|uniref:hypothetical protein n=1 Tax=Citrobacter enshiensis TaxID=2971264 RepID=UPI0023E8D561|nr:hypothetical protein [Citrobacter enshiensis]WET42489.1 hypothetical protein P2W74_10850 [Citrobacter enshiensis]
MFDDKRDTTVVFTDTEMNSFDDDAYLDLSQEVLSSRIGEELPTVSVLVDIDESEDLPPGVGREIYEDFSVFADKLNPTQLIIDREYDDNYFRITRPKDLSTIDSILQERIQDIKNNRELDEDYERERQERERDEWND